MTDNLPFIEVYNWRNFKIGNEYIHCYGTYGYDNELGEIVDNRRCALSEGNKKLKVLPTKKSFPKSFFSMQGCHVYHKYETDTLKVYDCFIRFNDCIYIFSKIKYGDDELFSILGYYDFKEGKCFFKDIDMSIIYKLNIIVDRKLERYLNSK